MRNLIIWPLLVAVLMLAGCSTLGLPGSHAWSYNPQNYAGCTVGVYETEQMTATWHDCKDKSHVDSVVDLNSDGKPDLTYKADDVVAADVMALRAAVEKSMVEAGAEVTPDIVNGVVDAVLGL